MDVEIPLTPVCSKCDRHAVAFNEKHLPLCGRHAMIFLTAPRMIARDAELRQISEATNAEQLVESVQEIGGPADPGEGDVVAADGTNDNGTNQIGDDDSADQVGADRVGMAGVDVMTAILDRLTAIEKALGIAAAPADMQSTQVEAIVEQAPLAGNPERQRSEQERRAADMRSGPNVVEAGHEGSRPWASGGAH